MEKWIDGLIERFSAFLFAQSCSWFLSCNIYELWSPRFKRQEAALALNTNNFMNALCVLVDWAKGLKHAESGYSALDRITIVVSKTTVTNGKVLNSNLWLLNNNLKNCTNQPKNFFVQV